MQSIPFNQALFKSLLTACIAAFCVHALEGRAVAQASFPVSIEIRADQSLGELKPIWRFFGADEPNYAYMRDGSQLLTELGEMNPGEVFFRAHNLLNTGEGIHALKWGSTNAYREDEQGQPIYDWTIVDRIFDTYLQRGVRPYLQIGFMPKALSTKPEPYQHSWSPRARYEQIYTGWAYPPKDYVKWAELVYQWTLHCIERYGEEETRQWYWQTWNEPNIGYWQGTDEEFYKLHDLAIDAVRRALPSARVGGPDLAGGPGGDYLQRFLEHCLRGKNHATGEIGTPLDFIAFHAKGSPRTVDGHVRMGIANQLRNINDAFKVIADFPEVKNTPIVIGESDPEGCAACQGDRLAYRNTTMYSSYTAASFARKHDLAAQYGVNLEGALTWAFTFEDQPLFAGFRQLATGGIDLPVLNVFRMFSKMQGERLESVSDHAVSMEEILSEGVRGEADVSALVSRKGNSMWIMAWHYHDDDLPGPDAAVKLQLTGLPVASGQAQLSEFRVDKNHGNSYETWKAMGSPDVPSLEQYAELKRAGELARLEGSPTVAIRESQATIPITLPRQGVTLLHLTW